MAKSTVLDPVRFAAVFTDAVDTFVARWRELEDTHSLPRAGIRFVRGAIVIDGRTFAVTLLDPHSADIVWRKSGRKGARRARDFRPRAPRVSADLDAYTRALLGAQ